ncbi:non-homologous end-joining DNA ligase [Thioalkalivibrio sp.]|uniref:non-homologous end-joining DNA ligase n=1 Tax=Thioalkalivibrio sp. TaxID=2093813 RepID=UPI00356681D1
MRIGGHDIDISSRDKVFFPATGLTKGDLVDYYATVAETMVPHMKRYGVSMERYPDGIDGKSFFHKDTPDYFPDWIETVNVPKREGGSFNAPIVDSKAALVYLADQAVLTPHLYLSRAVDLEHPDKMIYDLDPPEGIQDFDAVRQAALDIRGALREVDLDAWVQTTGSKGFHVVVPLDRSAEFDEVRKFAHDVALLLVRRNEPAYTLEARKAKRRGRIFLDTLRNAYGSSAVSPYGVRAREGAPVATPVTWDEVAQGVSPRDWTIQSVPRRLAQKDDPWADLRRHASSVTRRRKQLDKLLEREKPAEEED